VGQAGFDVLRALIDERHGIIDGAVMHARCLHALACAAVLTLAPALAHAEVKRIEITGRADVHNGAPFGEAGAYEHLVGTVYFALDPNNPRNKAIVNLEKAPRNANGQVEFSADLSIYKPKDTTRGNGVLLFDIVNRGGSVALGDLNRAERDGDIGDGFLMREGYTIVAVGWQFDVPPEEIGLNPPVATEKGKPIPGTISTWFIPNQAAPSVNFAANSVYAPVDLGGTQHRLTQRDGFYGTAATVPRGNWAFGSHETGVGDWRSLFLKTGFKPGVTYELTYETKDPPVAGVGFAAVRDLASAFKHGPDALVTGRHAYAFGRSQTGRFLRAFLHDGFNTDERERPAFDALFIHVAGAAFEFQRALCATERQPVLHDRVPVSLQDGARSGDWKDGRPRRAGAEGLRPQDFRRQLVYRVLGWEPHGRDDARVPRRAPGYRGR
jgi:hypothetical protein